MLTNSVQLAGTGFIKNISLTTNEDLRRGDERINRSCVTSGCVRKMNRNFENLKNFNFIFTREPIQRIYSAWKDKIYKREGRQYFYQKVNKRIFQSQVSHTV